MSLEGTSAIVTGGAGGLGEAAVRKLHEAGAAVVIADLAEEKGEKLVAELGARAAFVRMDVLDDESIGSAIAAAGAMGTLRYAVIAHGGFGVVEKIVNRDGTPASLDGFAKTISLYLNGTYNVLRLVSASMATEDVDGSGERGAIVMTASIAAYEGQIGQTAYAAAKSGVVGLTLAGARDLSSVKIRLNTIAPGTMMTPTMAMVGEEALEKFASSVPFPKRLGEPQEFGRLARDLIENCYINGEVVRLDGAQRFAPR